MNGLASLGAPVAPGAPPLVHSTSLGSGVQWAHSMDGPAAGQYLTHAVRARHAAPHTSYWVAAFFPGKAPVVLSVITVQCVHACSIVSTHLMRQQPGCFLCLRSCNQGSLIPTRLPPTAQHSPHPLVGAMSGSGGSGHFAAAGFDPRAPPGGLAMPSTALPSHLQAYPQYAGLPYLSQQQQQQQQHQQQQELYAQQLAQRCVAHTSRAWQRPHRVPASCICIPVHACLWHVP